MAKNYGFISIPNKFVRNEKLSIYEKMLFCVFYSYRGMSKIFLSYETLSKQSGMKRTKLIDTIKQLEQKKYIKVVKNVEHKTNIYQVLKKLPIRETDADIRHTNPQVRETDGVGSPDGRVPIRETDANNKYINNKTLIKDNTMSGKKKKPPDRSNGLPDWLDKVAWASWGKYRKEIKKTLKPSTVALQLKKLAQYKDIHAKIIYQSIEHGWTRLVYEVKEQGTRNNQWAKKPSNFIEAPAGKYDKYGDTPRVPYYKPPKPEREPTLEEIKEAREFGKEQVKKAMQMLDKEKAPKVQKEPEEQKTPAILTELTPKQRKERQDLLMKQAESLT
jgi:DNA-binding MarR family transcriptional regulator